MDAVTRSWPERSTTWTCLPRSDTWRALFSQVPVAHRALGITDAYDRIRVRQRHDSHQHRRHLNAWRACREGTARLGLPRTPVTVPRRYGVRGLPLRSTS